MHYKLTAVCLVLGVWMFTCKGRETKKPMNSLSLSTQFDRLQAWEDLSTDSAIDWSNYEDVAAQAMQQPLDTLEAAIGRYLRPDGSFEGSDPKESRVFLLLRFIFEMPNLVPVAERRSFKGWTNWPSPDENGQANPAWPLRFTEGKPRLVSRYGGSMGLPYDGEAELNWLKEKYPLKK